MRIIEATDAITVEHPVFLIFGEPGICKSSLGYSAPEPLLLDADKGAHRAANRRATAQVDSWADIEEITSQQSTLIRFQTLVPDTVGRVLDLMAAHIMSENPKYNRDGGLTLQGFGVLKARFQTWMTRLRAGGKDVLLIAHHKEDKNGDSLIVRPDITGGSYHEVMKIADFVGYVYMQGRRRVLDFNPTDRWVGKNPAGWDPIVIPEVAKATTFMADLMVKGRDALGAISAEGAAITASVEAWRTSLANMTTADEVNSALAGIVKLPHPTAIAQVKRLVLDRTKTLGFTFDKAQAKFVAPAPAPKLEPVGAGVVATPSAQDLGF